MASFKYGENKPYWDGQEPKQENTQGSKFLGVAGLFGFGAAIVGSGFIPTQTGNVFDSYYKASRVIGHASPFGLMASLRVSEGLSPFLSANYQSEGKGAVTWSAEYLKSQETRKWLSSISGKSEADLLSLGIGSDSSLHYERASGVHGRFGRGTLSSVSSSGVMTELSRDVSLIERSVTGDGDFVNRSSVNQLTEAMGSVVNEDHNLNRAFKYENNGVSTNTAHRWVPFHSVTGSMGTTGEKVNRAAYARGLFAFEAQRLNRAMQTIGESIPIVGEILQPFFKSDSLLVKNGPALKTYARYGMLAGKVGIAGLAISQYDWLQRYKKDEVYWNREVGYALSSSAIGGMAGYLAAGSKRSIKNFRPMVAAVTGISAFIGQNVLPGFENGLVAGVSGTLTSAGHARAVLGENSGFSTYRRKLEDLMPGSTSFAASAFAGILGYAAFSARHLEENRYYKFSQHFSRLRKNKNLTFGQAFKDLDLHFEAWEKISLNLKPSHDLASVKQKIKDGTWKRSLIPGQALNDRFETSISNAVKAGASIEDRAAMTIRHLNKSSHAKFKGVTGGILAFAAGFLTHTFATGKILGSMETPEELDRMAKGEQNVAIRKSRWWGAGGTPFEGGKIAYYRPSLNALIQSDSKNASVWGEDVANYSPVRRFFIKNFTYGLEEKNYQDRPYPISSPGFSTVPFFGKVLGATIGSIIKPPKLMHVDEWARTENGETQYKNVPKSLDSNPALSIGGTGVGAPVSPYRADEVLGDLQYRLREASGFIGFAKNTLQRIATGEETYSSGGKLLAESNAMYDMSKDFWDLELGGFASLTEIPRRFFSKERRSARDRYNPIRNKMPSWMPEEFKTGDPYSRLPSGSSRLPGHGYSALHPDLKDVDPENYPLWYKFEILSNVAPYSKEFRKVKSKIYSMRKNGKLSPDIELMIDNIDKNVASQRLKRNYYIESEEQKNQSYPERLIRNTYFNTLDFVKKIAAPFEYLTFGGIRPFQKFLPPGDVISDYEQYSIYGSETSFWEFGRAWKDYLGPSINSYLRTVGYSEIPAELQKKREIDQHFDRLTYYKYMKLAQSAEASGDYASAGDFKRSAHKTVYGANPFGNPLSIYGALPAAEKERFEGFSRAYKPSDRQRILELLPEDQKILFTGIWAQQDGLAPGRKDNYKYSDEFKMNNLESYFSSNPMPREDWIGWRSEVDLNDVKLRYIKKQGYDSFDFGMWQNQEEMMSRKPYLEGSEDGIEYSPPGVISSMWRALAAKRNIPLLTSSQRNNSGGFTNSTSVTYINDNREHEIRREYEKWNEN